MVRTRSTTRQIESGGQVHRDDRSNRTSIELDPRDCPPTRVKKHRGGGSVVTKEQCREKQGQLCQLNFDVLFLIAGYIYPVDLLNLARTCKSVRDLLMDRSSAFIWKTARHQVEGLPDCPTDLTEPEYANLTFCTHCHGCGRYAKDVLWEIRHRYCSGCKIERLCYLSSCDEVIRKNHILGVDYVKIEGETIVCVDKEQMDALMNQYRRSSNKTQLLSDKAQQLDDIRRHAYACEAWQMIVAMDHKADLEARRQERADCVFKKLEQVGYQAVISHFGRTGIQDALDSSCRSLFGRSKRLTDTEWNHIWPKCADVMNEFTSRLMEDRVYNPRRQSLTIACTNYVASPPTNTPAYDIFPHVADVACFPPFENLIKAPEESGIWMNSFEPLFSQLPQFVNEWKKRLDADIAELVKIPTHLALEGTLGRNIASSSLTTSELSPPPVVKLHLACAVFFDTWAGMFTYPHILFASMRCATYPFQDPKKLERTGSIHNRYDFEWVQDAPYIVHACGLDPYVATADDMDRRNARLRCITCENSHVMTWKAALWHAHLKHQCGSRWQAIADEHIAAIEAAEKKKSFRDRYSRCLLCRPHIGGVKHRSEIRCHVRDSHEIEDPRQGEHYEKLMTMNEWSSVEMVKNAGGKVTFKWSRANSPPWPWFWN